MGLGAIYLSYRIMSSFIYIFFIKLHICTFFHPKNCVFIKLNYFFDQEKFYDLFDDLSLKKMILAQYSKNRREFKDIFYLTVTDQTQNISSKLCYHARFFTATDSTKSKQR